MEFSTPKSGILDEQVPGEVLSAEQAERAELEAALLAQVPGQVLGGINENVVQPAVEGFSQFIDPVGFAQDQLAPASATVSPLDETQPAMAPLPLGNLSPEAQVAAMQQETDLLNRTAADAAQQEALLAEFNRITAAASVDVTQTLRLAC